MVSEIRIAHEKNLIEKILDQKAIIFIVFGFLIRIGILFYYYYTHMIDPGRSWGDMGRYFDSNIHSSLLTIVFLEVFRLLSFGAVEIFIFWGFLLDLISTLLVYLILKNFNMKNLNYIFGLFLINPFFYLNNSFSLENCGYHITDALFFIFLFVALIYYPKEKKSSRYVFYIFLGLSMCIKYYTLPAVGFFFLKYIQEKNWKEMKMLLISIIPSIIVFLVLPLFLSDWFFNGLFVFYSAGVELPIYIKIIPMAIFSFIFIIFRLKKSDPMEITIISTVATGFFLIFSFFYLRWFQLILFYGILKEKEFFAYELNLGSIKRKIIFSNHLITFYLSFLATICSVLLIIFVY